MIDLTLILFITQKAFASIMISKQGVYTTTMMVS